MSRLRAAVIGVGSMGRNHARILAGMKDIELVGVVDQDQDTCQKVASGCGTSAYIELETLPSVDFAVVAVPTSEHVPVAERLINAGVSVLVEKPLASTPEQAELLVKLAATKGVLLGVGHVERFNPVVTALANLTEAPRLIQISRLSPFTPRIRDSIVFDLMVHDIDIACMLAGNQPISVAAVGAKVYSEMADVASVLLTFPDGCIASVTSSRITQDKVRKISVSENDRYLEGDCLKQELSIKRETTAEYVPNMGYRQASIVEIPYLDKGSEPLALELRNFADTLLGTASLRMDGKAGAAVVALTYDIERKIEDSW